LTLAQGTPGSSTISTAVTSGSASTVNLSVSGVPTGATASFNPTSITAGNSSTLTVNAGSASPGTYSLTVTGTSSSATHSTPLTLTVKKPQQAPTFTSANKATFIVGQQGSFTVATTGFPTPSITESGALPSGVTFHDNGNGTASLAGAPAAGTGGSYPITFTAANGVTPNATQKFTLAISSVKATLTPPSTTFLPQRVGVASTAKTLTLKNLLSSAINITNASFSGPNASDFSRTGGTCPFPSGALASSATCTYLVAFKPSSNTMEGPVTFTVSTDLAGSPSATMKGAGTIVKLSPTSENFGSVKVGTASAPKTITVTNLSSAQDLTITNIALSGPQASEFTIDPSSTCPTGGGTLVHSSTCTVVLKSTPSALGARKATVIFTDIDGGTPQKVNLTTTGS
jgi:hypothetical protein